MVSQLACLKEPSPEPNPIPEGLSQVQSRLGDVIESDGKKEGRKKVRYELLPNNPVGPRSSEEDVELCYSISKLLIRFSLMNQLKIKLITEIISPDRKNQNCFRILKNVFLREEKIQDAINYHQQITQVVQTVEFQEKRIQKDEALQQQIVTYQSYNSKLEEILQAQNRLKTHIEEANKSIQQTDKQFLDKHQSQIQELNDKLNDYQEKYQYFSTNQKYSIQITQVINQIGQAFCYLNNLKQLISQRTLPAYQQYTQIYSEIQQSLKSFEKQHSQLHQKIYNDEQIQLKNHERIKTLEMTKNQLDQFNQQMNQFKEQVKNLIKNEYCNNETTRNLINNKLKNMDQNIKEQNEQFDKFTQFNQEDKCENIDEQIKQLEEFQGKLKELKANNQKIKKFLLQIINYEIGLENICRPYNQFNLNFKQLNQQKKNPRKELKMNQAFWIDMKKTSNTKCTVI
ncbi:unnamed protein product (macronuclear) [Paramecium tetraurelia]|uniref:Uncharacterized protein n=1 Tax=Paramecium tetraurelia TaxID=5888 RepID=A0CHW6_PARTE|nr:uncharacterized protein GSPATT00038485001 [Paramecium tetraurelia]CAK70383.1 unnamed protein product [Paramecium tetraurelia]|eukprot:XP_001437780.1 hypothetical protein (macronuclear) [Paramecium tetraurelia strain d4-2]